MRPSCSLLAFTARVALLALGALALTSGCMPPVAPQAESLAFGHHAWRVRREPWPSIAADDLRAIESAESAPTSIPEGKSLAPQVTPPDPQRARFDSAAALAAIHDTDVSGCAARGAPLGYGHARLTFERMGSVAQVAIEAPSGLTDDAIACVGEELGRARVAPFDGPDISVGASFLVARAAK